MLALIALISAYFLARFVYRSENAEQRNRVVCNMDFENASR